MQSEKSAQLEKDYCLYCGDEIMPNDPVETMLDRGGVEVGVAHTGFCAHQWRISRA